MAQRLRKHTPRLGAFQAWNKCLNHLLALARAHVESVMLTSILEGCSACPDADSRKSLKVGNLRSLHRHACCKGGVCVMRGGLCSVVIHHCLDSLDALSVHSVYRACSGLGPKVVDHLQRLASSIIEG